MFSRSTRIRLAAIGFSFAVLLAAIEIGVRVFEAFNPPYRQFDSALGFRYTPNAKVTIYSKESERFVQLSINKKGFRDVDHNTEKSKGVQRVLFLGDSFVSATQVDFEDSFHRRMQQKLNSKNPDSFEALNMGVSGYGTIQSYLAFEHLGRYYSPNVVVLCLFIGNDVGNNYEPLSDNGRPFLIQNPDGAYSQDTTQPKNPYGEGILESHSRLYRLILTKLDNLLKKYDYYTRSRSLKHRYNVFMKRPPKEWQIAWEITEKTLTILRDAVEDSGARFVLLAIPDAIQVYPNLWDHAMRNYEPAKENRLDPHIPLTKLAEIATRNDLDYINLYEPIIEHSEHMSQNFFFGRAHLNLQGHELVSEILIEHVTTLTR